MTDRETSKLVLVHVPLSPEDEEAVRSFHRYLAHERETEVRLINAKHRYAKPPIHRPRTEEEFVDLARAHNGLREIYAAWAERRPGGSQYADVIRATLVPLDVDLVEGGTFDDALALADEVLAWAEDEGLEPPRRVRSGTGIHLYFAIPPVEFRAASERDRFACGLARFVDTVRAATAGASGAEVDAPVKDLARLMRVPGTVHLKDPARPRPTGLIDPLERVEDPELLARLYALADAPAPRRRVHP